MKFLKQLLDTKAPPSDRLLDIALILSIIPHLFVMKFFMLLYLFIALLFLLKRSKTERDSTILMIIGLILIAVSFFNNYNFSDFSKMQFFVSLVSSLLIYAVTLQKMTKESNIYLKISPALLLLLSFFFFNSITMLIYTIFTLFVFTLLNIWSRMEVKLIEVVKITSQLFVLSLPIVVILFLVFPRISFEKAEFGFRADSYSLSGYDGEMIVSDKEVKASNRIVMELYFKDANITDDNLYFRGTTLNKQDGLEWKKRVNRSAPSKLEEVKNILEYDVTLYPHANDWIYALDMPIAAIRKSKLNSDYTITSKKLLYEIKRYRLSSALSYKLTSEYSPNNLEVDILKSKKTYSALKSIKALSISKPKKAQHLLKFFRDQNLSYSSKPKALNLEDFTDSFLFESKNGYCVHFASAFATSARMLDIPSRVVTGFKSSQQNMIGNYLIVRSLDAHAWVELYFDTQGWVRFEPTATASQNLDDIHNIQNQLNQKNTLLQKANLYFMYTKYIISSYILEYNRIKQLEILENLLSDTLYLLKFVLAFIALSALSFLIYLNLKNSVCIDKSMCEMQKLLKVLKKYDLEKKESETMQLFLQRAERKLNISLSAISESYHHLKYAQNDDEFNLNQLKLSIKKVLLTLKGTSNINFGFSRF